MADGGCVEQGFLGAASAGVEAEEGRERGRRTGSSWFWLGRRLGGRWAKRLWVAGRGVWLAAASGPGVAAQAGRGLSVKACGFVLTFFMPGAGWVTVVSVGLVGGRRRGSLAHEAGSCSACSWSPS